MASIFAILHHLAAFSLVAALFVEFDQIREDLSVQSARNLQRADLIFGISAGVVLIVGFFRVIYFEKGLYYYLHSVPFITKMTIFVIVVLLSIYPTVVFLSWRKSLKQGQAPMVTDRKLRVIRSIINLELVGFVLVIICAMLMANGVGYRG